MTPFVCVTAADVKRTRADLAAEVNALLGEGLTSRQVAERLGYSYSMIREVISDPDASKRARRREGYQGRCVDCGAVTHSDGGTTASPRCPTCAVEANRRWTRERAIEVIQEFARVHGRPPTSTEWLHHIREPRLTVGTVQALFGTWAAGIEAAGFERPRIGNKTNRMGRGAGMKMRTYYVLHKNGDGAFNAVTVEAFSPEQAIEKVADSEGEWVAVLERYWVSATVKTQTRLAVVKA